MKKITAALLCFVLLMSCAPALAAPSRDVRALEVTVTQGMTDALEIAVQAALGPEWPAAFDQGAEGAFVLEDASKAEGELASLTLAYAMVRTGVEGALPLEDAQNLLARVYTDWTGSVDEGALLEKTEEGFAPRPDAMATGYRVGVYVYSALFDGKDVTVDADIFFCPQEYEGDAEELPEDAATWLMNGQFSLRFAPETMLGYTVNALSLSSFYRDGNFAAWQEWQEDVKNGYTVNLPGSVKRTDEGDGYSEWKNDEGDVTVRISVTDETLEYEQALSRYMQANPDRKVVQDRLYDCFYSFGDGRFEMVITADDYPKTYTVIMTFPDERAAEYALYAEIIRNSFGVWGISNG